MITKDQKHHLSQEVLCQEIEGESVLLDMKSENYFALNDVGSSILEALKTGTDVDTLVESLLVIYDVEKQQLENDTIELLQQLLDAGLILPTKKT